jgi:hypothetical protein
LQSFLVAAAELHKNPRIFNGETEDALDELLIHVSDTVARFFVAAALVQRREFRSFVGPALHDSTSIRALEWVPVVRAGDRNALLERPVEVFYASGSANAIGPGRGSIALVGVEDP